MIVNQPTVDIVIAAHNEEAKIADCLDSLLEQDYPRDKVRVIVVDSASTDSTATIVARYPVERIRDSKGGAARARNRGIACGNGELIGFLDAHCILHREWISAMTAVFADKRVGGCQGFTELFASDERVANQIVRTRMHDHEHLLQATLRGDLNIYPWVLSGNSMFRRSAVEEVEGFDETLPSCEDVDISWRLVLAGYLLGYAPTAKVVHWNSDTWDAYARKSYQQGRGAAVLARRYLAFGAENIFEPVDIGGNDDAKAIARGYEEGYRAEEARIASGEISVTAFENGATSNDVARSFEWRKGHQLSLSPDTVYWFPDDATSVIVHNPTRSRIVLDGTADTIWRSLTAGKSRDEIAGNLAQSYSIDPVTSTADCDEFVEELIASSILISGRE